MLSWSIHSCQQGISFPSALWGISRMGRSFTTSAQSSRSIWACSIRRPDIEKSHASVPEQRMPLRWGNS